MNDRAVTIAVGEMLCVPISNVDLQESQQSGESEEGPVIPLLLQNKPPVDEEANDRDELADLHLRPEPVSDWTCMYSPTDLFICRLKLKGSEGDR